MTASVKAVARVTLWVAGLGIAGGIAGGLLLVLILSTMELVSSGPSDLLANALFISLIAAFWGATYGAVLGPTLGWTLLRRAPLWRAIGETALASTLAVGVAIGLSAGLWIFWAPMLAAVAAALRLRIEVGRNRMLPSSAETAS